MVKQTKKQEPIQLPEGFDEELEDLGIITPRNSKWTEEQMAYLKRYFPRVGAHPVLCEKCGTKGNPRTVESVKDKARRMRIYYTGETDE